MCTLREFSSLVHINFYYIVEKRRVFAPNYSVEKISPFKSFISCILTAV